MHKSEDIWVSVYLKKRKRWKAWQKVLSALICVVVFCTTYALILPGITQERETFCGLEAHTHEDACYLISTGELICQMEEVASHTHGEACYVTSELVQVQQTCQLAEAEPHIHGEGCYLPAHTHGDNCYGMTEEALVCGQEEVQPHSHDDNCFTPGETVLSCGMEESEAHSHSDACWSQQETCVCGMEETLGHCHGETCYSQPEQILLCTLDEREADEFICQLEETAGHIHEQTCFLWEEVEIEPKLTCQLEETEGHAHQDTCYRQDGAFEPQLICQLEEHTHDLICYSDPHADVETAEDWEKTFNNVELTGLWSQDVLAIAESQMGYQESTANYVVREDGTTLSGYTRYGAWYGVPYGDWCAMFTSFCLHYAQVESMPLNSVCATWIQELDELGWYQEAGTYAPLPGDLIFFDWNANGISDHVGFVAEVDEAQLTTIEGNSGNQVRRNTYDLTDKTILGYGVLPANPYWVPKEELPADYQVLTASIFTDGTFTTAAEDSTVITIAGLIPEGAQVWAYAVTVENELDVVCAYDISIFLPDGTLFEPEEGENITVSIQSGALAPDEDLQVYYVPDEGAPEAMDTTVTDEGVTFEAPHFSTYAVTRAQFSTASNTSQFSNLINSGVNIRLEADLQIDNGYHLGDGRSRIIDLNGHRLVSTNTLFTIQNGSVTIMDSQAPEETVEQTSLNPLGAHAATVSRNFSNAVTLTYYVTRSVPTGSPNGTTKETVFKHTVTTGGYIEGRGSAVFLVVGGTLNLESGMIYGGTGRAIANDWSNSASVANLSGGYICGFRHSGTGGAVHMGNGTLNISDAAVLAANHADGNGGAVAVTGGKMTISGGVISGNTVSSSSHSTGLGANGLNKDLRRSGGGVYVDQCTLEMSGGYVTNNNCLATGYWGGGGGIWLQSASTFRLTGGYITGNEAAGGGGVRMADCEYDLRLIMTGGYVCSNLAREAEGGGITLGIYAVGEVFSGYINNNRTNTTVEWGGGGLFAANDSYLYVKNVLVTGNDAGGYGGGVSGCSTARIHISITDGGAIFENHADGQNLSGDGSTKHEDWIYAYDNTVFNTHGYQDFFCALNVSVEGGMMGGYAANWSGSADGVPVVSAGVDDILQAQYIMGLNAAPTAEGKEAARNAAAARNGVYISGNSSNTHGGGILCNGYMLIGTPDAIYVGARIALEADKKFMSSDGELLEMTKGQFTFNLVDASTNAVVARASNSEAGDIEFSERLSFSAPGTYIFYIQEVTGDDPTIAYDSAVYRLTVKVSEVASTDTILSSFVSNLVKYQYMVDSIQVDKKVGDQWVNYVESYDPDDSDNSAITLDLGPGTFTNVQMDDEASITVVKKWSGGTPAPIQVSLKRDGQVQDTVTLSASNNWTYTWKELPVYGGDNHAYKYTVEEDVPDGFVAEYKTDYGVVADAKWVPATSLVPGEKYIILSRDGTKALYITKGDYAFADTDVYNMGSGEVPDQCIVVAQSYGNNTVLKVDTMPSWLETTLTDGTHDWDQGQPYNYLKTTGGVQYASGFSLNNGQLISNSGQVVVYRDDDGDGRREFTSASGYGITDAAVVYVQEIQGVSFDTTITITNRAVEDITYELDITKVSGLDQEVTLAGAEFNLVDRAGNVLYFLKTSSTSSAYTLSEAGVSGATQTLVTDKQGKLVLKGLGPETYIIRETKAPAGYQLAAEKAVAVGGGTTSVALTIVDHPEGEVLYLLPQTGGMGTMMCITAGVAVLLMGALLLKSLAKRRREDFWFS